MNAAGSRSLGLVTTPSTGGTCGVDGGEPAVRLYVIAGRRGYTTRHPEHFRQDLARLIGLLRDRRIRPEVTRMPLHLAADAHRALEAGKVTGKLVLVP